MFFITKAVIFIKKLKVDFFVDLPPKISFDSDKSGNEKQSTELQNYEIYLVNSKAYIGL